MQRKLIFTKACLLLTAILLRPISVSAADLPKVPDSLQIEALELQTQAIAAERDYYQHDAARLAAMLKSQEIGAKLKAVAAKMQTACGDSLLSRDDKNRPICVLKPQEEKLKAK
jgi:hypothetical protein